MIHGRTHLHEFKRDDGSIILIEYKRNPYFGATGPSWNDPGSPAEGGDVAEWEADDGVTLSAAEEERATDELNAIPFDPYEEDYGDA